MADEGSSHVAHDDPSSEGENERVSSGRLYPICCVAPLNAEVLNRFIDADKEKNSAHNNYWFRQFVFPDDLNTCYEEQDDNERMKGPVPAESPFIDKTPEECHELLKELRAKTASDIDPYSFAIMDRRSQDDDSVLTVQVTGNGIASVRAEFSLAIPVMACWMTGHSSIEEDIRRANFRWDGVLRWQSLNG